MFSPIDRPLLIPVIFLPCSYILVNKSINYLNLLTTSPYLEKLERIKESLIGSTIFSTPVKYNFYELGILRYSENEMMHFYPFLNLRTVQFCSN